MSARRPLRRIGLAVGLVAASVAGLVIAFVCATGERAFVDHAEHREQLTQLRRAREHQRARVEAALQIRSGARVDFDELVTHKRALDRTLRALLVVTEMAEPAAREAGRRELDEVVRNDRAVSRELERFKSNAAIARNSALYISRLVDELSAYGSAADGRVATALGRLQLELLRFEQMATSETQRRIRARARELVELELRGPTRERVELLVQHIDLWLQHEGATRANAESIVGAGAVDVVIHAERGAAARYESAIRGAQRVRALIVALVLAFIALVTAALAWRRGDGGSSVSP